MVEQQEEEQELPPIPYLVGKVLDIFPTPCFSLGEGGVELHLPGRREPSWC